MRVALAIVVLVAGTLAVRGAQPQPLTRRTVSRIPTPPPALVARFLGRGGASIRPLAR